MIPVLYSFRRCPYAMRARLAIATANTQTELREILLRDKAPDFLKTSPSGTVPCLQTADTIIDESLDVMKWALRQNDPDAWLDMPTAGHDLIATADGPFKQALDRTKYATRYPDQDPEQERAKAHAFLHDLNAQLTQKYLFKDTPTLADMAILPFVRQFANIDKARFDAENWPNLARWLDDFLASPLFQSILQKYPTWQSGDSPTYFP
jgi:glutathione S-transferase